MYLGQLPWVPRFPGYHFEQRCSVAAVELQLALDFLEQLALLESEFSSPSFVRLHINKFQIT